MLNYRPRRKRIEDTLKKMGIDKKSTPLSATTDITLTIEQIRALPFIDKISIHKEHQQQNDTGRLRNNVHPTIQLKKKLKRENA
jgi:hypothetical protein